MELFEWLHANSGALNSLLTLALVLATGAYARLSARLVQFAHNGLVCGSL
jgi:hypothetical protein